MKEPAESIDYRVGSPMPGTKWVVRGKLGEGGMGVVLDVIKESFLEGAMKILLPRYAQLPEFAARFLDEVKLTATLQHPNIVQVLDFDRLEDGTPFMVMERLHGRTLRAALRDTARLGRPWTPSNAYAVAAHICQGLARAHTHEPSIVHRDIKPENIFLHRPKGAADPVVKVMDFGIAAVVGQSDRNAVGTPRYMAPEQLAGKPVSPQTDQYAFGLLVYEMLTGRLPWEVNLSDVPALAEAHLHTPPKPPSAFCAWLPPSVDAALLKALSKDPDARHASVHGLLFELRALQASERPRAGAADTTDPMVGTIAEGYPPVRLDPDLLPQPLLAPWESQAARDPGPRAEPGITTWFRGMRRDGNVDSHAADPNTAPTGAERARGDAPAEAQTGVDAPSFAPSTAGAPTAATGAFPVHRVALVALVTFGLTTALVAYVRRPEAPAVARTPTAPIPSATSETPSPSPPPSATPGPVLIPIPVATRLSEPIPFPVRMDEKTTAPWRMQWPCPGCRISLPASNDPRPVLVLLHGDNETADSMFKAWAPAAEARALVVLALSCPASEGCTSKSWWQWNGDPSYVLKQVRLVAQHEPIDPARMWIVGWSGGGTFIGYRTQEFEKDFAAIVIHGGGVRPAYADCSTPKASVYFLVGDANPLHNLAVQLRDYYRSCEHDVTWTLLKGADHDGERRALASREEAILDWLADKRRPLPSEAPKAAANP